MEKLKTILNQYFFLFIPAVFIAVLIVIYLLIAPGETVEQTVTTQTTAANQAVREAVNAQNAAVNASIERRTEDAARTRIIQPKLDAARRKSQSSKAALEKAQKELENEKLNLQNLERDITANCAELKRLYPNTNFAYCQP